MVLGHRLCGFAVANCILALRFWEHQQKTLLSVYKTIILWIHISSWILGMLRDIEEGILFVLGSMYLWGVLSVSGCSYIIETARYRSKIIILSWWQFHCASEYAISELMHCPGFVVASSEWRHLIFQTPKTTSNNEVNYIFWLASR